MKVGCGFVEKEIRGNRYLYFWSFQGHGAHAGRANAELAERVAAWRRELRRP